MSRSFADAARGRGLTLAGPTFEEDVSASWKANPLEVILRCPKTLTPVPVLQALVSRCGPEAITCVRSISATNYAVTCRLDADILVLLNSPSLDVDGSRCSLSRAWEPLRSITLRNLPFDASEEDMRQLLAPHASLIDWTHETYKDFPEIANGNRRLHVKMPTALPNFLTFRKKRVIVSYNGVQLLCFKCGSPDHSKKDCNTASKDPTTTTSSEVVKPVDPEPAASKSMPPPETPNKVNKRKKPNASPAPSQSPSPRHKRQHGQSPAASAVEKQKFTTPTSSPRTRRTRISSKDSPVHTPLTEDEVDMLEFHELIFKHYLVADDDGMRFRPHVAARWIQHWCESCWHDSDIFKPDECKSTPACDGRFVSEFGLPKTLGMHLFCLSTEDAYTFCRFDVRPKSWNVLHIDDNVLFHRGPFIPEYASAPT